MVSTVSKWGKLQGIRISKKLLQSAGLNLNDTVEIKVQKNIFIIKPTAKTTAKKKLDWYLEGYDDQSDRYDRGVSDEPMGRELL